MADYILETNDWDTWAFLAEFDTLDLVYDYISTSLSDQISYRIIDRVTDRVISEYKAISSWEEEAANDLARFNDRRLFMEDKQRRQARLSRLHRIGVRHSNRRQNGRMYNPISWDDLFGKPSYAKIDKSLCWKEYGF